MRRRKLTPLAGLVALSVAAALAGCTTGAAPAPTPTDASPSASPTATTVAPPPDADPINPESLPGSAFLRISATADVGDQQVELVLTVARAATATTAAADFQALLDECPNAIESQLDVFVGQEPTGVITSRLEMEGDWPDGMTFAVAPGGFIASIGEGRGIAPSQDDPGAFGCTVPVVTGPGSATFASLLLGDPAVNDRVDLDAALARGLFGFESDAGSAMTVRWRDCVIQLSSAAQRLATENARVLPGEWGDGCLIGDGGTV